MSVPRINLIRRGQVETVKYLTIRDIAVVFLVWCLFFGGVIALFITRR